MFLSVHGTGDGKCCIPYQISAFNSRINLVVLPPVTDYYQDYLHLTKRFGMIAVSQFPAHYALSMKSMFSPFALLFRASHEELNPYHRYFGRIVHFLLTIHGVLYFNFFYQSGIVWMKLGQTVVLVGVVALGMITTLVTTSLASIRRWSYRVFFVLHLVIGVSVLPLLWFHARHLRLYVVEALVLFLMDIVGRKMDTAQGFSKVSVIPHSNLIKIVIPIPSSKIQRFRDAPGQHVYLSLPPQSISKEKASPIYDLLFNPFTVAAVSSKDITLVLRALHGPTTKALAKLSKLPKANPPLNVEGPYGAARKFPNLALNFDRVLLVAGGVGATFILPIYEHLRASMQQESMMPTKVEVVWSMRSAAEASWTKQSDLDLAEDNGNVSIYVTRAASDDLGSYDQPIPRNGSVELDTLRRRDEPVIANGGRGRPDLGKIVDNVFRHGYEERVAVMICGPTEMAVELREHVGKWVAKGRHVWYHDEAFGW